MDGPQGCWLWAQMVLIVAASSVGKTNQPGQQALFLSPVYFRPISLCLKPVSCGLRSAEGLAGGLGIFLPVRWAGLDFSPSLGDRSFPGFSVSWVHREGADREGDRTR